MLQLLNLLVLKTIIPCSQHEQNTRLASLRNLHQHNSTNPVVPEEGPQVPDTAAISAVQGEHHALIMIGKLCCFEGYLATAVFATPASTLPSQRKSRTSEAIVWKAHYLRIAIHAGVHSLAG